MELLLAFLHLQKTKNEVLKSELLNKANASQSQFNALCEKKILIAEKRNIDRISFLPKDIKIDFELSEAQSKAFDEVNQAFESKNVSLLHGVTGSGKTQVYIKLIESFIKSGKQVLYLLPEIALTSQIIRRIRKHFGGHIAVYHSKFNDQERIELWNKIRKGEVSIVLGARSALFLPFSNLGFVIVDEEHDASFKQQDPAPRYHARDAAIYYASLFNAKVLLGSGTPSLESYYNAKQQKYGLINLSERFGNIKLPAIETVNVAQVAQKGKIILSPQLKAAMESVLKDGKQIILFQNRRGYNPYLICGTCGFIPQCNHCDVSLTLHKYSNKLHCHYCGSIYPKLHTCTACGNNNWMEKNFGTEKIEEILESEFPKYRIGRMDIDSVKGKSAHDTLIQSFEQHRLDVLVGTQMVVKGLDFDNVSLVGILDADGLLSFADFRVNERAYQLMEQVSGRAGRKGAQGKVIIQALNVKHPVIKMVEEHNFLKLYEQEIASRKEFLYPPFSRLIKLTLKHKDNEVVQKAASKLADSLRSDFTGAVVGPASPIIARMRNQYLMEIMIKLPKEAGMGMKFKKVIRHHINLLQTDKICRSITIIADVDPV
jgi:primosomal protein N' (replication factor Y)